MKVLLLIAVSFAAVLVACGPPPCGPDCDPEIDAAYEEFQAEEASQNYEIDKSVEKLDQYYEDWS